MFVWLLDKHVHWEASLLKIWLTAFFFCVRLDILLFFNYSTYVQPPSSRRSYWELHLLICACTSPKESDWSTWTSHCIGPNIQVSSKRTETIAVLSFLTHWTFTGGCMNGAAGIRRLPPLASTDYRNFGEKPLLARFKAMIQLSI